MPIDHTTQGLMKKCWHHGLVISQYHSRGKCHTKVTFILYTKYYFVMYHVLCLKTEEHVWSWCSIYFQSPVVAFAIHTTHSCTEAMHFKYIDWGYSSLKVWYLCNVITFSTCISELFLGNYLVISFTEKSCQRVSCYVKVLMRHFSQKKRAKSLVSAL